MWVIMSKKIFHEEEDFVIWYELEQDEIIVHIQIINATRKSMNKALEKWSEFKAQAYYHGYERILTYTRDERMFKWFPFAEYKGEIGNDNFKLGVWQWVLE